MSKSSEEGAGGNTSPQDAGAAGGGQKDANSIYEDRGRTKKIIRVVTVMAYVFSVSFVAILLSAYYVFLWEPPNPRLQRHPLTGDPQAEYLMDNLLLSPNLKNLGNASEDQSMEFEDPNVRRSIFKKIMTSGQEVRDFHQKPATLPQRLLTYEDLLELHNAATRLEDFSDDGSKSTETLTTLPIIFNGLAGGNDGSIKQGIEPEKLTRNKKMDITLGGKTWPFFENKDTEIKTVERNERRNEFTESEQPGESTNDKTTAESSTADLRSTEDLGATVYPGIGNYSYPEAIGGTVKNNEVTIGSSVFVTSESSTTVQVPVLINDPEDDNLDESLREHESRILENMENEESSTTESELQIYPGVISMNIIDEEK